jgi:putative transposase
MGIKQAPSAPRTPWQRAYVERVIGAIRRECKDSQKHRPIQPAESGRITAIQKAGGLHHRWERRAA